MSNETNKLKLLEAENKSLINEIQYLRSLLEKNGIEYSEGSVSPNKKIENIQPECIINENITVEQIYLSLYFMAEQMYMQDGLLVRPEMLDILLRAVTFGSMVYVPKEKAKRRNVLIVPIAVGLS